MASTMVPEAADRPDVLPSERLLANGMAIPALRKDLRQIDNLGNAAHIAPAISDPPLPAVKTAVRLSAMGVPWNQENNGREDAPRCCPALPEP